MTMLELLSKVIQIKCLKMNARKKNQQINFSFLDNFFPSIDLFGDNEVIFKYDNSSDHQTKGLKNFL